MSNSSVSSNPLYPKALEQLKKYWGYEAFRPGQDLAVQAALDGRDSLILLPTGGGKSLCYQIPALCFDGLTIVISPLVALMQDQVYQLEKRGVKATFINSSLSRNESEQRMINARNHMYTFLYVAPEKLVSKSFQYQLEDIEVSMIAIDEAHCISEWGHEFRPSYRNIKENLNQFSHLPWMAVTATATPKVADDIVAALDLDNEVRVKGSFERKNLKWWISKADSHPDKLLQVIRKQEGKTGLIYAPRRSRTIELANYFKKHGIKAEGYHAGLSHGERKVIQDNWQKDEIQLVIATSAFGMGIDKSDCRYVLHDQIPASLEAYYQEAGRAGRDGKLSFPILFYDAHHIQQIKNQITSRYPSLDCLQKVYDAVCDSLDITLGWQQEGEWFEALDIHALERRSKLSSAVIYAALEQLQVQDIFLVETKTKPIVTITIAVNAFERKDLTAQKLDFLDRLSRMIYAHGTGKNGNQLEVRHLADRLGLSTNVLERSLVILQEEHALTFDWQEKQLLVRLKENRVAKLQISEKEFFRRRDIQLEKLHWVQMFAETNVCRSVFLQYYFGDTKAQACGICDNCVKYHNEGSTVHLSDIIGFLKEYGESHRDQILAHFDENDPTNLMQWLGLLVAEDIIREEGDFYKINPQKKD